MEAADATAGINREDLDGEADATSWPLQYGSSRSATKEGGCVATGAVAHQTSQTTGQLPIRPRHGQDQVSGSVLTLAWDRRGQRSPSE